MLRIVVTCYQWHLILHKAIILHKLHAKSYKIIQCFFSLGIMHVGVMNQALKTGCDLEGTTTTA